MAARSGPSCCLYQSRTGLIQRDLCAELAADAALEPFGSFGRIARRRPLSLFAEVLRGILCIGHHPHVAVLGEEAFDRGPSDGVHRDEDAGPDRGKREGPTPASAVL